MFQLIFGSWFNLYVFFVQFRIFLFDLRESWVNPENKVNKYMSNKLFISALILNFVFRLRFNLYEIPVVKALEAWEKKQTLCLITLTVLFEPGFYRLSRHKRYKAVFIYSKHCLENILRRVNIFHLKISIFPLKITHPGLCCEILLKIDENVSVSHIWWTVHMWSQRFMFLSYESCWYKIEACDDLPQWTKAIGVTSWLFFEKMSYFYSCSVETDECVDRTGEVVRQP